MYTNCDAAAVLCSSILVTFMFRKLYVLDFEKKEENGDWPIIRHNTNFMYPPEICFKCIQYQYIFGNIICINLPRKTKKIKYGKAEK